MEIFYWLGTQYEKIHWIFVCKIIEFMALSLNLRLILLLQLVLKKIAQRKRRSFCEKANLKGKSDED